MAISFRAAAVGLAVLLGLLLWLVLDISRTPAPPTALSPSARSRPGNLSVPVAFSPAQSQELTGEGWDPASKTLPGTSVPTAKEEILTGIQNAATTYDPASLPSIARYFESSDPEIRSAAIDGVMLLGDAAGAPLLRQLAASTGNPAEASELRSKADYLELPPAKLLTPEKIKAIKERQAAKKAKAQKKSIPNP